MGTNIHVNFRLEEKLKEGRDVSTVLGMVSKEKERENTRLWGLISMLILDWRRS